MSSDGTPAGLKRQGPAEFSQSGPPEIQPGPDRNEEKNGHDPDKDLAWLPEQELLVQFVNERDEKTAPLPVTQGAGGRWVDGNDVPALFGRCGSRILEPGMERVTLVERKDEGVGGDQSGCTVRAPATMSLRD